MSRAGPLNEGGADVIDDSSEQRKTSVASCVPEARLVRTSLPADQLSNEFPH